MNKNWCLVVYLHLGFFDLVRVSIVSELKSPCSALCIEAPESITNMRSSVSLALSQENKTWLSSSLSLHIFSPKSTLLCWYSLFVVRFLQVVVPQKLARKDFAHEVHFFG